MEEESKPRWGWIGFGVGLAACVIAGGVLGIVLGQQDSEDRSDEARRVAALALDASALSDDALALSRSIEEAVDREELESEAASLRERLALIDGQAESIRYRVEAENESIRSSTFASRSDARRVKRTLQRIGSSLAVFRDEVVAGLDSTLESPSSPGSRVEDDLADLRLVMEEQGEVLTALADDLREPGEGHESTLVEAAGEDGVISGEFDAVLLATGQPVEIEYELIELTATRASAGVANEAEIVSSASGSLIVDAGDRAQDVETLGLRTTLYWRHADLPANVIHALATRSSLAGESAGEALPVERDPCRYEIEGELHCALVEIRFGGEGSDEGARTTSDQPPLSPGEEITLVAVESVVLFGVVDGVADPVADLIETGQPHVIQVTAHSSGGEGFAPGCVQPAEDALSRAVTLALLDGGGEVIYESADTDRTAHIGESGYGSPPECYAVVPEPA